MRASEPERSEPPTIGVAARSQDVPRITRRRRWTFRSNGEEHSYAAITDLRPAIGQRVISGVRRLRQAETVLAIETFVLVHVVIVMAIAVAPNGPIQDVSELYRHWVTAGIRTGVWSGIDEPSVYPVVALIPMVLASGGGVAHIVGGWLILVTALDALAAIAIWRLRVGGTRVVWWWFAFLLLLGPIALSRIDTVATALSLLAVAYVLTRPAVASVLFTVAGWMKVWPAALVAVLLVRNRRRGAVLVSALVVTAAVVAADALLGGAPFVTSFIDAQAGRGLQTESVLATPFTWAVAAHQPGASIFFNQAIIAVEVTAPGTAVAAALSTPLMASLVLLTIALVAVGLLRHVSTVEIMPLFTTALVMTLIAANKVGSPQYVGWIAVPILWGLSADHSSGLRFRVPAALALATAFLTQLIYPWFYGPVIRANPVFLGILTARNALEVALLLWALIVLAGVALQPSPTRARYRQNVS